MLYLKKFKILLCPKYFGENMAKKKSIISLKIIIFRQGRVIHALIIKLLHISNRKIPKKFVENNFLPPKFFSSNFLRFSSLLRVGVVTKT